ncbi:O-antigen ligase family protein [Williamsia sp. CHRR-6]|uniref:O-antigen ligase family protein n=1 Tax=Williamsia sp. CHRR-6 TaxID=2835871 RepID=UPI001BD96F70|nr:O-antigen ligase family protein [Williamsia sp. CHRR-6]MBT0566287.1 O-antigen ligase family protein [Williamsia sp. CHRR-6]
MTSLLPVRVGAAPPPPPSAPSTRVRGARGLLSRHPFAAPATVVLMIISAVALMSVGFSSILAFAPIAAVIACVAVWLGLRHPLVALGYFLVALFFRLALPRILPIDLFLPAFAGLLLSVVIWLRAHPRRLPRIGAVEVAMLAYFFCNVYSAITPHEYGTESYLSNSEQLDITRLLLSCTVMPFMLYYIGRTVSDDRRRAEVVLWMVVGFAAFSSFVSIGQFHFPSLVWPQYIVTSPNWVGRANGVANQPVVNGIGLVVGFAVCMYLLSRRHASPVGRWIAGIVLVASAYSVFLTHTRIIYLALVLVLVVGAAIAKGYRSGFVLAAVLGAALVIANWSTFTSSDRAKGGVGSTNEVFDRLNTAATSIWAFEHKPLFGWGLGRFIPINTLHHQQWSTSTPWDRGLGIASHFNELGILAELGLVGLLLWLGVLATLAHRLVRAYRSPREGDEAFSRALTVSAALALMVLITAGTSVDLRLFDFPSVLVMVLVGVAVGQSEGPPAPGTSPPPAPGTGSTGGLDPEWLNAPDPEPDTTDRDADRIADHDLSTESTR